MNSPSTSFRWNALSLADNPVHLNATLGGGQSFRWRRDAQGIWWGAVGELAFALVQDSPDGTLFWQSFPDPDCFDVLSDYLRLEVDLPALYADWIAADPRIANSISAYRGLRNLRQPPNECFFAFQCATCNNVVKIERSVAKLAERYGARIGIDAPEAPSPIHAFPTIAALANADEAVLRFDLWGYRAPRVIGLARELNERPPNWLNDLRDRPYAGAHAALTELHGIGPKVADCICLFCLDKDDAVPVDTHVRKLAERLYAPGIVGRSLTPRVYAEVVAAFQGRFGPFAGWAQQYLFTGMLRRGDSLRG